jgi:hypothetical protein
VGIRRGAAGKTGAREAGAARARPRSAVALTDGEDRREAGPLSRRPAEAPRRGARWPASLAEGSDVKLLGFERAIA